MLTHLWAVLIIAIVVALFFSAFNLLSITVPSSCTFLASIQCSDLVFGTNQLHTSTLIALLTNEQPYPIKNAMLSVNINGTNSTAYLCHPTFVLAGGSMTCIVPLSGIISKNGQMFAGKLYLSAMNCGFESIPSSSNSALCTNVPIEINQGSFNAQAGNYLLPSTSVTLYATNSTNPANNAKDIIYANVMLLGYPLEGATVRFSAIFVNGINALPLYTLLPNYTLTNSTGIAQTYIWSTTPGNIIVQAHYAGVATAISITFTNSISTSTTTSTTSTTSTTIHYVPITLQNTQGSATPAPFQQMLAINSQTYQTYINSGWSNVEFTTGSGGSGSVLQAWTESNPSNTATNTVVWVNLPNAINANSNTVIYMNFMPSNVMSLSGPTGEAPQLSSSYGQYDNGNTVFSSYYDFVGNSLPGGWAPTGNVVISNGATVGNSVSFGILNTPWSYNIPYVVEILVKPENNGASWPWLNCYSAECFIIEGGTSGNNYVTNYWNGNSYVFGSSIGFTGYDTWVIDSITMASTTSNLNYLNVNNLGNAYGPSGYTIPSTPTSVIYFEGVLGPQYAQWIRVRPYLPNGAMPSASFGSVV